MKLTRTIIAICLCMVAVAGFAQKATNNPFFRFATKAEAQMLITDNQPVKKGDLLIVIDPSDYEAKLAQSKAKLADSFRQFWIIFWFSKVSM